MLICSTFDSCNVTVQDTDVCNGLPLIPMSMIVWAASYQPVHVAASFTRFFLQLQNIYLPFEFPRSINYHVSMKFIAAYQPTRLASTLTPSNI